MRKTNGRSRPVCGSHVRSAAVETLEIWRMPFASASSATALRELARVRPHDGEGAVAGGERGGVARVDEVAAGAVLREPQRPPVDASLAVHVLDREARALQRLQAGHRVAADGGEDGGDGQGAPGADPVGGEHDGVDPVRGHRGGPLAVPGAQARGGDEGQEEDDGRGPLRHRGQRSTPAWAAVRRGAAARRAGPGPRGGRAPRSSRSPRERRAPPRTSRRPARSSASSAAWSASSGWLFFRERWARTTCRHASPRPFSRSRPTSPFERCPSGPRMRSLSDQGYGPSRSIAGS